MPINMRRSSSASRGDERNERLLDQKNAPDAVMVGVLLVALLLGLVGLAVPVLWIVAIIVMALGLGFAAANRRRDRMDVVNRAADRDEERADQQDGQSAAGMAADVQPNLPRSAA